jgi:hypothetical protein
LEVGNVPGLFSSRSPFIFERAQRIDRESSHTLPYNAAARLFGAKTTTRKAIDHRGDKLSGGLEPRIGAWLGVSLVIRAKRATLHLAPKPNALALPEQPE